MAPPVGRPSCVTSARPAVAPADHVNPIRSTSPGASFPWRLSSAVADVAASSLSRRPALNIHARWAGGRVPPQDGRRVDQGREECSPLQGESSTHIHAVSAGKALAWVVHQDQLLGGTDSIVHIDACLPVEASGFSDELLGWIDSDDVTSPQSEPRVAVPGPVPTSTTRWPLAPTPYWLNRSNMLLGKPARWRP
jgi:hypothetical protein